MINLTSVPINVSQGFYDSSGACVPASNELIGWVNSVLQHEVLSCAKYARLLEVGLICAAVVVIVVDWLGRINTKKALARAERAELELLALKGEVEK